MTTKREQTDAARIKSLLDAMEAVLAVGGARILSAEGRVQTMLGLAEEAIARERGPLVRCFGAARGCPNFVRAGVKGGHATTYCGGPCRTWAYRERQKAARGSCPTEVEESA